MRLAVATRPRRALAVALTLAVAAGTAPACGDTAAGSRADAGSDVPVDALSDAPTPDAGQGDSVDDVPVTDTPDVHDASDGGRIDPCVGSPVAAERALPPDVWRDHAVPRLACVADFEAYAAAPDAGSSAPAQLKFALGGFSDGDPSPLAGDAWFMDAGFYQLHDEVYWYRLLGGEAFEGLDVAPVEGLSFPTIASVYEAYDGFGNEELPLDLRWTGSRLYSPAFYAAGLGWGDFGPRYFGLGSLLHFEANPERAVPEELWVFELEYADRDVTAGEVERFFERLSARLPGAIAGDLRWLARNAHQVALGEALVDTGSPYADRVLTYADLVVAGEVAGYTQGLSAGRPKRVALQALGAASLGPKDIAVLEGVPDDLPPVAGILTATPQTPLAHLNLLAASRGTPNAFVAGVFEDAQLATWESALTPMALRVRAASAHWIPMTLPQYAAYLDLLTPHTPAVPTVAIDGLPYTLDLAPYGLADLPALVAQVGGKAAGMAALADHPGAERPFAPLAVTVRAYAEHLAPHAPTVEALLSDPVFVANRLARYAALEGAAGFVDAHLGDPVAMAWYLETFLPSHGPGTLLGDLLAMGGLKRLIRDTALSLDVAQALQDGLSAQYAALGPSQGLRFRSSSTAEDIPGFNGAGLYDSNTGYLWPQAAPDPADAHKTTAWALKKTWASYWSFEAFEERRLAGVPHLEGRMGVLVHPRFDDPAEVANGVMTFELGPAIPQTGAPPPRLARLVVNVQAGALSVTNPPPGSGAQPEIDEVVAIGAAAPTLTRVQPSSEVAHAVVVLDDALLTALHADLTAFAEAWLAQTGQGLPMPQAPQSVVLDLEFKVMAPSWPAWSAGSEPGRAPAGPRFVYKQVRVLDRALPEDPELLAGPLPRDVLGAATRVERRRCTTPIFRLDVDEAWTDPAAPFGALHAAVPFVAAVTLTWLVDVPELGATAGQATALQHPTFGAVAHPGLAEGGPWRLLLEPKPALVELGLFSRLEVGDDGTWRVEGAGGAPAGQGASCEVQSLLAGPVAYLESLFEAADAGASGGGGDAP